MPSAARSRLPTSAWCRRSITPAVSRSHSTVFAGLWPSMPPAGSCRRSRTRAPRTSRTRSNFTLWSPSRRLLLRTVAGDFMLGAAVASGLRAAGLALLAAFLIAAPAVAQFGAPPAPPPSAVPAPAGRNAVVLRRRGQPAFLDRGTVDPARAGLGKGTTDAAANKHT